MFSPFSANDGRYNNHNSRKMKKNVDIYILKILIMKGKSPVTQHNI